VGVAVAVGVRLGRTARVGKTTASSVFGWQAAASSSPTNNKNVNEFRKRIFSPPGIHNDQTGMAINVQKYILFIIILISSAACQPTLVTPEIIIVTGVMSAPTINPTLTPRSLATPAATHTPVPTLTFTLRPLATASASVTSLVTAIHSSTPAPEMTASPTVAANSTPVSTLLPTGNTFIVGQSAQGRDILAWQFGAGAKVLLLVGGVHTGYEANTVMLVNEMVTHFQADANDILPGMTLVLIPVLNPDGLLAGKQAEGRFNANGVDLNRNWGCDWSADSVWQGRKVDPGPRAFSEPETTALAQLVRRLKPGAVVLYHSAANGVFAGNCNGDHGSQLLAETLGKAAGYPYDQPFTAYRINGAASNWIDGQGIPAAEVELTGTRDTEIVRNLRGVMAVQCWLTGAAVPMCAG
jgi:hypothetical protein